MLLDDHMEDDEDSDSDSDNEGNSKGRPKLSNAEKQQIKDEFKEALLSAAQTSGAGNLPAGLRRMLKDLTEPKIDWREFIRQQIQSTVKNDYTYAIPSRKNFQNGFALPSMLKQNSIEVCIGLDTSGSITDEMARDFFSEVKAIMDTFEDHKINLWCWDTEVHNPQEFTAHSSEDIMDYEIKGFGGTDPTVCWDFMKMEGIEPTLLLMFTDGEIWGDWCPPGDESYADTIWIINNKHNKTIEPPFGRFSYYEND
jgi:predicted metal-dependent peptidase